jgi:hypothetical protein
MDSIRDSLGLLQGLGLELPTPTYLAGVLLFGIAGIVLWVQGRRRRKPAVKWIGLALMLYPYGVWSSAPLYIIGLLLCGAALWAWRRA